MESSQPSLIKFLPSYVGSKAYWVRGLDRYRGRHFVEFFGGSGVISANLASRAILNDTDPFLWRYFMEYESQPVMETFTEADYFDRRGRPDWWRWLYYLQKMSFSGVYRHSRNGYNVPIKQSYRGGSVSLADDLHRSVARFRELAPELYMLDYADVPVPEERDVAVLDPPYESKKAAYNVKFDYGRYWEFVGECVRAFRTVIVFDWDQNMEAHLPGRPYLKRNMRVNGKHKGATEAMCVIDNEGGWP